MIFDAENMFFEDKALSSGSITSDIVFVGKGEAGDPLTLVAQIIGATSGTLSIDLVTATDEAFTSPVTLATYETFPVKTKLPRGNKGYLKLTATSTYTDGTLTAGLVLDDDVL